MGKFAKVAAEALDSWKEDARQQVDRFRKVMPLTEEQTAVVAREILRRRAEAAYLLGRKARLQQVANPNLPMSGFDVMQGMGQAPGRELVVEMPSKKAASAITGLAQSLRDKLEDLYKEVQLEKARGMMPTEDPATLPWFYPAQVKMLPEAFRKGFADVGKEIAQQRLGGVETQLTDAKRQFEEALIAERGIGKSGSFEPLMRTLEAAYEKRALLEEGDISRLLGYYLSGATAIHGGAESIAHDWMARRDPRRLEAKALATVIKRRAREAPQPVYAVSSKSIPPADSSAAVDIPKQLDNKDLVSVEQPAESAEVMS